MYKRIDFSKLGGLATYQDTLDFLQTSYRDAISAVAKAFGSKVIVTGVTDLGTTYTDGWIIIDGELMPFTGGLKSDRIVVTENTNAEIFNDGSVQTVYYAKVATLGITGGYAFSDFIRVDTMSAISQGLKSLITAHNNLQSAFNTHTHSWNDITNKPGSFTPSGHRHDWNDVDNKPSLLTVLHRGAQHIGDFDGAGDAIIPIYFNRNIGTASYMVFTSLVSAGDWNGDNDAFCMVRDKNTTYFNLLIRQVSGTKQDLWVDYLIIPF